MTLLHQAAQKAVDKLKQASGGLAYFLGVKQEPRFVVGSQNDIRAVIDSLESALQQQPEPVALTDEQIKAIAQQWFVTGENQLRADGYYYRSMGTVTNVRESDLIAFAREVLARAEAWPAIREAITNDVMPNIRALQQQEVPREPPESELVCYEAYAALGTFLMELAEGGHPQAEKLLDNLSQARLAHKDVLPFAPSTTRQQEVGSIVAELVAGLQRAEAKRKQKLSDLPAGTCETCMGEGYLGSIESQRVTDCPDCIGGVRVGAAAPSTPESAEKDDAGGGKGVDRG